MNIDILIYAIKRITKINEFWADYFLLEFLQRINFCLAALDIEISMS